MTSFKVPSAGGIELHGRDWPVTSGEPKAVLALVHGFGEHSGRYAHMAAHLNARGIAVVALDLRGHGESPGARGVVSDYDDFRADLAALLDKARALYPARPLILFGHSMGGGVVLDYGFNPADDIRAIIASAPLIGLAQPVPAPVRFIAKLIGKIRPTAAMSQPIDGTKISNLPEEQTIYMNDPLNHGRLGFRLARAMVETGEAIAARADRWETPLLLFHSRQDQLTSFEASETFAARAKNVTFRAFENVAHEMHNDTTRGEVYDLITAFTLQHAETKTA